MSEKRNNYEENYNILESISEQLNRDEIGVDDLVDKTKEALKAAKICLNILNEQRGKFIKLEEEFSALINKDEENNK